MPSLKRTSTASSSSSTSTVVPK
ncbi:hypothetical protein JCM6882_006376, partial [Rhodosporidiobolus microsporus]